MLFYIFEVIPDVEGADMGGRWNGWRRPRFPKASADQIVDAHNAAHSLGALAKYERAAWYEEGPRTYHFYHPDSDETDVYPCTVVDGVETWAIGADGWTWEGES